MELVANVWPVVSSRSGLVQRYFMRAYAIEADDQVINQILAALAPADFQLAESFNISKYSQVVTANGTLAGVATLDDFYQQSHLILYPAYRYLEKQYASASVSAAESAGSPFIDHPKFADNPFLLITTLHETAEGQLLKQRSS